MENIPSSSLACGSGMYRCVSYRKQIAK